MDSWGWKSSAVNTFTRIRLKFKALAWSGYPLFFVFCLLYFINRRDRLMMYQGSARLFYVKCLMTLTLVLGFMSIMIANVDAYEESCHSFAGGSVYPSFSKHEGHQLHTSKAFIGKKAPYWEGTAVIDGEFKELKLTDFKGKYLVFFFYPLDFTFVCPTEILAFSDRIEEFKKLDVEVVAASVDSHFTHLAWINTPRKEGGIEKINVPLLSDLTHSIAKDYGVYLDDLGHTLRALFIIDDKGILRQITMNDLPVGRSVDETLRLVQAFQYTDKHAEVCPAGWKPGQDTIIPNPKDKIKFFSKH